MKKIESYLEVSMNADTPKKPYMYRDMILEGWAAIDDPFLFNRNLAASMDIHGYNYRSLAKECQNYSNARGLGIRMTAASIRQYVRLEAKPKGDKRDLLCAVLNIHKSWLTGYNGVAGKEAKAEAAIASYSDAGLKMVTERNYTARAKIPSFPKVISINTYNSMNQLLTEARILEENLKKDA